jgi:cell division protease FtsH
MFDAWLPVGYAFPDGAVMKRPAFAGREWQILEVRGDGRALVVQDGLAQRWIKSSLLDSGALAPFNVGEQSLNSLVCGSTRLLCPVAEGPSPRTKADALAFALALKATRDIDPDSPLQDALYVEKLSRLLPTYSISPRVDDDVLLGYWLTGGANVSVKSFRRLATMVSWLGAANLKQVVEVAGFEVATVVPGERSTVVVPTEEITLQTEPIAIVAGDQSGFRTFELPGRPDLARFFNEHVVDIIQHSDRYKALGIDFPSAIVLYGPPGCGKTFAVEQLVEFLGWPSFEIDASSVASPYIHETSRKVAEVFDKAMENSPSVLVIDEMEAFLADREMGAGSSHHRVEEVAEFLRRIPEAVKNHVLIIAMTNRVDMIDPAVLRRGRFDHVVEVGFASEIEIRSLLEKLFASLPKGEDVDAIPLAAKLAGRPLSDVSFVVREGARLAARSNKGKLDQESLLQALREAPAREREGSVKRRMGFI